MPTRRAFLAMLASVPFLSRRNSISTEEDSRLPHFDPTNAPPEPYGDLDLAAWRPIDLMPQFGGQMAINISKAWERRKDRDA
jgi:hypothetical protein